MIKKFLLILLILLIQATQVIAEKKSLNIGCNIMLNTKEDLSHIENSLRYFQEKLDDGDLDIAMFLIHSLGNLKSYLNRDNDCLYSANKILGTNHDAAIKILKKKLPFIVKYEFRNIYTKFYQYEEQNNKIKKRIKNSSIFESDEFAEELINYFYINLKSDYKKNNNSLSNLCYFEEELLLKIKYCKDSSKKDDLYAAAFLGRMYLFGIEDPDKKGYFLKDSKNFTLSEKYIIKTDQLMNGILQLSRLNYGESYGESLRDSKNLNWAKYFNNNEIIKIYKKAINGNAEAQYKMGILSISHLTPRGGYNLAADLEKFFGSFILENKIDSKKKYIPNCVQSINWFEKSSKQNFAPAQYVLHELYLNDHKTNYFYNNLNIYTPYQDINSQPIRKSCVEEKKEERLNKGYDLLFKAAENKEYRAQCKLGLLYSFTNDDEIRNLELGLTYILLSQEPRKQNLWKESYHIEYHLFNKINKRGFDLDDKEKCGKGSYKYLFPENPYYDQDLRLGERDEFDILDYSNFINGNMFNNNSVFYQRLVKENKILSSK